MTLIDDWKEVLQKAWSVKFSVLAALLGGVEVALAIIEPVGVPRGVFAALAGVVSTTAVVARILAQNELTKVPDVVPAD
jgi:Kef-type K+ transport system membrane component KefB